MADKKHKSAKDVAFEKEKQKLQRKIKKLQRQLDAAQSQIKQIKEASNEKDAAIREKDDWICRLLEYMDMPEEQMRKTIETEKQQNEFNDHLNAIMKRLFR